MILKKLHCFLLFVLTFHISQAQISLGLEAGSSNDYLNTNISNRASTAINSETGYSFGLPFRYKILPWLYAGVTPNITQKDYSINRTDSLAGVYARYNNTYLQLPMMAHFVYGKRLQAFANVGIYMGYWFAGHIKGNTPNIFAVTSTNTNTGQTIENFQLSAYNEKYIFDSQRDNRWELGWMAGGGLQYKLTGKYIIFWECSYYQSLTDQQKKYMVNQISQYNRTIVFSVGGLYPLK
jgi:hypothetical protein